MQIPKFRIWHKMRNTFDSKTKVWSFVWKMSPVDILNLRTQEVTLDSKYGFANRLYRVGKDCVLMQNIGLADIGGTDIFIGDIVKVTETVTGKQFQGIVRQEGALCYILADSEILADWSNYRLEVIGNEYENPDKQ